MLSRFLKLSTLLLALTPVVTAQSATRVLDLTGDGLPDKLLTAADGWLSVEVNHGAGRFLAVE